MPTTFIIWGPVGKSFPNEYTNGGDTIGTIEKF